VKSLYSYWRAISPPGRLPGRQHFDPLDVPRLLPNIWQIGVDEGQSVFLIPRGPH